MMKVSVVVPCRNEVGYISAFVSNILEQDLGDMILEVLVADGRSTDGTRDLLEELVASHAFLDWVDNERLVVSSGLNLCIARATGDIIVRMDVHTSYSQNYILSCVQALSSTNASCVGGPWIARGYSPKQRAIAAAFQTRIASGGASSRSSAVCGPVDTVYLGAWWRSDLIRLGGFDESLVRNQDDELSLRIIREGGVIWQSPEIQSFYFPRSSYISLCRQFVQYGYWKMLVIKKHRLPASFRHVVPLLFFSLLSVAAVLSALWQPALFVFFGLLSLYSIVLVIGSRVDDSPGLPLVACSVFLMHASYALGSARGFWDFFVVGRTRSNSMSNVTR